MRVVWDVRFDMCVCVLRMDSVQRQIEIYSQKWWDAAEELLPWTCVVDRRLKQGGFGAGKEGQDRKQQWIAAWLL